MSLHRDSRSKGPEPRVGDQRSPYEGQPRTERVEAYGGPERRRYQQEWERWAINDRRRSTFSYGARR